MSGFVIQKKSIGEWLDSLGKSYSVYTPKTGEGDIVQFAPRAKGTVPDWDHLTTTASPKGSFFPCSETLLQYDASEGALSLNEMLPDEQPRVLFGVRKCDARALLALDKVFAGEDLDPYYARRRSNTALVAVGCQKPRVGCFCEALGAQDAPWDILLTDLGESFYVEACTERGSAMVKMAASSMAPASEADSKASQKATEQFTSQFKSLFNLEAIAKRASSMWDDPIWIELSRRCIGCGACSYLCPTCHCFDIQDESAGKKGIRFRCWDTCQERDFTHMGHGHNPRPSRKERHRQRVLHKFQYFPTRFGMTACVGCGRCVEKCPVNIDIREVLEYFSK